MISRRLLLGGLIGAAVPKPKFGPEPPLWSDPKGPAQGYVNYVQIFRRTLEITPVYPSWSLDRPQRDSFILWWPL